jgi:AraC-like DNA-binding protein
MHARAHDHQYAQAAKEILTNNYRNKITIAEIAASIGIGERTLKRAFRNVYQTGIYQYQVHLRMEKAKEYLSQDKTSIKQAAILVGYKRQSSFTKRFFKSYRMTPSEWLQRMKLEEKAQGNEVQQG